jgi:hypothetical protein
MEFNAVAVAAASALCRLAEEEATKGPLKPVSIQHRALSSPLRLSTSSFSRGWSSLERDVGSTMWHCFCLRCLFACGLLLKCGAVVLHAGCRKSSVETSVACHTGLPRRTQLNPTSHMPVFLSTLQIEAAMLVLGDPAGSEIPK